MSRSSKRDNAKAPPIVSQAPITATGLGSGSPVYPGVQVTQGYSLSQRRPIPSHFEHPTRYWSPYMDPYGFFNGMENLPQPTGILGGFTVKPKFFQDILPTVTWMCSCEFCQISVKEYLVALNISNNRMYTTSGSGQVYRELLGPIASQLAGQFYNVPVPPVNTANTTGGMGMVYKNLGYYDGVSGVMSGFGSGLLPTPTVNGFAGRVNVTTPSYSYGTVPNCPGAYCSYCNSSECAMASTTYVYGADLPPITEECEPEENRSTKAGTTDDGSDKTEVSSKAAGESSDVTGDSSDLKRHSTELADNSTHKITCTTGKTANSFYLDGSSNADDCGKAEEVLKENKKSTQKSEGQAA